MPSWDLSRIKRLKLEKSLEEDRLVTYAEIAEAIGISVPQVERYANGRVENPNLEVMDKIGKFFGHDWMYFVVEDTNKKRANFALEAAHSLNAVSG
jgi:transcriptional regulator with XRE-family HTH domain